MLLSSMLCLLVFFFFQAEDGIRDYKVTGVQTCALPISYGFRPKRSATEALEAIRVAANGGYNHVADVDIKDYFGSIDHHRLMAEVSRRVSDRRGLKLIRGGVGGGVLGEGGREGWGAGTPQGGGISP